MSGCKQTPNIKILVVYHKPFKLLDNDVFVPIHAGRDVAFEKSKDGIISQKDFDWLLKNMIGDNTGDNISKLNRDFCEVTAIYWAWKNYDKLGNPDYIGLMHYRTFFNTGQLMENANHKLYDRNFLAEIFKEYDGMISRRMFKAKEPNGYVRKGCSEYNKELKDVADLFNTEEYYAHYKNMFILKREDFLEYCEWMFSILFKYQNAINVERWGGYMAEEVSSFYFIYLYKFKHRKLLELPWLMLPDTPKKKLKSILKLVAFKFLSIICKKNKSEYLRKYCGEAAKCGLLKL